jgi:hypothetical protein
MARYGRTFPRRKSEGGEFSALPWFAEKVSDDLMPFSL